MFKLNKRYCYDTSMGHKVDNYYSGHYGEVLRKDFDTTHNKLLELGTTVSNYRPDVLTVDIPKWVRLSDPSCINVSDAHRTIQNRKFKNKFYNIIQQMTLPGLMTSIMTLAKNKPTDEKGKLRQWVIKFINPSSEWYHEKFAKDLFETHPAWCTINLNKDQMKELIEYYISSTGKIPSSTHDKWILPKNHPLTRFKGSIINGLLLSYKKLGTGADKRKFLIEMNMKKLQKELIDRKQIKFSFPPTPIGKEFHVFKTIDPAWHKTMLEKYKYLNDVEYRKNTFLPEGCRKQVDRWNATLQLIDTKETDEELMCRFAHEFHGSRPKGGTLGSKVAVISNTFSIMVRCWGTTSTNAKQKNRNKIMSNEVRSIIKKIKEKRPLLVDFFEYKAGIKKKCELSDWTNFTAPWTSCKIREQSKIPSLEKKYLKIAKDKKVLGKPLGGFMAKLNMLVTRQGSVGFQKEIKKLRPEWFERKSN